MGKSLRVIHFNDVYNVEAGNNEPVGGAARFVHQIKALSAAAAAAGEAPPLVLFGGDAFNPSLMSTMTQGKQMVPILNAAGVRAAVVGNHDMDYGIDNFVELTGSCSFPWLMANVLDVNTGQPLGGVGRTLLLQHHGISVGLVGLAEQEWVETLATIDPEAVDYLDFVAEGRRLATELRVAGADVVIALTHMRVPNDLLLLQQVPEIDAVLGGHDHHYQVEVVQPHNNLLCKSGTDFKDLTEVVICLPDALDKGHDAAAAAAAAAPAAAAAVAAAGAGIVIEGSQQQQQQHHHHHHRQRPTFTWTRYTITSQIPEDPETALIVSEFSELMGSRMNEVIAQTYTDLDGRFTTVRRRESNLCNLLCDVFRRACSADTCILNSGTFRSDVIHPSGNLTYRDLVAILPMIDETTVLEVMMSDGEQLLQALENGVSQYPKLEGRFPQVSGIRFTFDAAQPPLSRIITSSVTIGSERSPLDPAKAYTLATKHYLAEGKDGYDVLVGSKVLVDTERCLEMQTAIRNFFKMLEVVNCFEATKASDEAVRVRAFARRWSQAVKHKGRDQLTDIIVTGNCIRHPESNRLVVAPAADGRISIVNGEQPDNDE